MFLLEITLFVCSVRLNKKNQKLYSHKQFKHSLSCQFNRNRPEDATHLRTEHRSQCVSLQHFISLSFPVSHRSAIPSNNILAGQIATSTCFNTAAATKSREGTWLDLLEQHNFECTESKVEKYRKSCSKSRDREKEADAGRRGWQEIWGKTNRKSD